MKFTEAQLENAIIQLLGEQGYPHALGGEIDRGITDVLIEDDLRSYLSSQYADVGITANEVNGIIRQLTLLSAGDLYESNKTFCKWLSDGFLLKRDDSTQKDIYIQLLDYSDLTQMRVPTADEVDASSEQLVKGETATVGDGNIYKIVNQLEIEGVASASGGQLCIPDGILYINGLPLVLFEFKSAIREEATIHDAYVQICTRYRRDIPQLFVYNALCYCCLSQNTIC